MSARDEQRYYESLLYDALHSPLGLLLRVSDLTRARAALYSARRRLADDALAGLQFRALPADHAEAAEGTELLMIVNGPKPAAAPQAPQALDISDLE